MVSWLLRLRFWGRLTGRLSVVISVRRSVFSRVRRNRCTLRLRRLMFRLLLRLNYLLRRLCVRLCSLRSRLVVRTIRSLRLTVSLLLCGCVLCASVSWLGAGCVRLSGFRLRLRLSNLIVRLLRLNLGPWCLWRLCCVMVLLLTVVFGLVRSLRLVTRLLRGRWPLRL